MDEEEAFQAAVAKGLFNGLVSKKPGKIIKNAIPDSIRSQVAYDPDSGVFTQLANAPRSKAGHRYRKHVRGGYLVIKHKGKTYYAHRIAWFLVTGNQPVEDIDHKDGDAKNNRWANLRVASRSDNNANRNWSDGPLPRGISMTASGRYRARISRERDRITIGTFSTLEEASAAYIKASVELHGDFSKFGDAHV